MTKLKDVIETLDKAADSFGGIANAEQKKIYEDVITLAKDLDTDIFGKVKQSIANLKRLTQIKAKLAALSKDKEWVAGITGFAKYFGELQRLQNAYYSQHFPEHTLSMRAKEKNNLMRQMAIQNTMEALMGDGLKANVTDKLNDILLRAVTTGSKFADLQEELRAHLMGKEGGQGAFARYATTYATTALSQFTGQQNKLLSEGLDTEWFMYTGSNKETTREFCEQLTKKKFIHKSEIPTILTGRIDDYQCAIYEKTGLPYGMIEGTTPENFQCNCGGWNCRHQLVPVADAVVPANLRAKFAKTTPTEATPEPPINGFTSSQEKELLAYLRQNAGDFDFTEEELNKENKDSVYYRYKLSVVRYKIIENEKEKQKQREQERAMRVRTRSVEDCVQSISKEEHYFGDGILKIHGTYPNVTASPYSYTKKCNVYKTNSGATVYIPVGIDKNKQPISVIQIEEAYSAMPHALRDCIDYFQLTEIYNPADEYWTQHYYKGKKKLVSFATDGRKITYFRSDQYLEGDAGFGIGDKYESYTYGATYHEAGHSFDQKHNIVNSGEWGKAVNADEKLNSGNKWVSDYARNSQSLAEDFADSVKILLEEGSVAFRLQYPNRYRILKTYGLT